MTLGGDMGEEDEEDQDKKYPLRNTPPSEKSRGGMTHRGGGENAQDDDGNFVGGGDHVAVKIEGKSGKMTQPKLGDEWVLMTSGELRPTSEKEVVSGQPTFAFTGRPDGTSGKAAAARAMRTLGGQTGGKTQHMTRGAVPSPVDTAQGGEKKARTREDWPLAVTAILQENIQRSNASAAAMASFATIVAVRSDQDSEDGSDEEEHHRKFQALLLNDFMVTGMLHGFAPA
jgi:hypothetical protein